MIIEIKELINIEEVLKELDNLLDYQLRKGQIELYDM